MLMRHIVPVPVICSLNLCRRNFSILTGQGKYLMTCRFNRSGFMHIYMPCIHTEYTLMRAQYRRNDCQVSLCAAHQQMHLRMSIAAKLLQDCFRVLCMRIAAIAGILLPVCLLQFLQYFLVHTFQVITFKTYHFSPPFFILIDIPGRRPSYFIQSIPMFLRKI